jgi:hypothetical protein
MRQATLKTLSSLSALSLTVALVAIPSRAYAYLDPGTGSMVLQVVIAGILGAAFTFKTYIRAIFGPVLGLFKKSGTQSDV